MCDVKSGGVTQAEKGYEGSTPVVTAYNVYVGGNIVKQTAQEDFLLTSIIHFERYYFTPEYKKLNNVSCEYDHFNG